MQTLQDCEVCEKGDNRRIFSLFEGEKKPLNIGIFSDTMKANFFTLHDYNLARGLHYFVILGLMTLTFSRSQMGQKHTLQSVFLDPCSLWFKCCLVARYVTNMHNMDCASLVCIQGKYM